MSVSLECAKTRGLDQRNSFMEDESNPNKSPEQLKSDLFSKKPAENGIEHQLNK